MRQIATASQHKAVRSMELQVFQFGAEKKPIQTAPKWTNLYFCAADGTPLVKPAASTTGLGTWTCKACHGHKVTRQRA